MTALRAVLILAIIIGMAMTPALVPTVLPFLNGQSPLTAG